MKKVLELLLEYWQLFAAAILLILTIIVSIVKAHKTKGDVFTTLKEQLLEQLPTWISLVECDKNGPEKKIQVLQDALTYSSKVLGHKLSDMERDYIISFADKSIEAILGTPQKKLGGTKNGAKGK